MSDAPRVPVQIFASERVEAALKFAAGSGPVSNLGESLGYLCHLLSRVLSAPVCSVYVLEGKGELVLRGNHGFPAAAIGEVRLQVGQGITGTAVETMRPVTVDDAGLTAQFAYFPQLAEERYPAFLAVPLAAGARPVGALVLQREAGPFTEADVLLALASARPIAALLEHERPAGANLVLTGEGNGRGRALGMVRVLSRVLARREGRGKVDAAARSEAKARLEAAFEEERTELRDLFGQARAAAAVAATGAAPGEKPARLPVELETVMEDHRLVERALEHLDSGLSPSQALERLAAESARALAAHGPMARRALEVEAFASGVAHRHAGQAADRVRKGELIVAVQLSGIAALRAWAHGAVGALVASSSEESPGVALLTALGLPVVSDLPHLFDRLGNGDKIGLEAQSGEVVVNPSAAQAAGWRR